MRSENKECKVMMVGMQCFEAFYKYLNLSCNIQLNSY